MDGGFKVIEIVRRFYFNQKIEKKNLFHRNNGMKHNHRCQTYFEKTYHDF